MNTKVNSETEIPETKIKKQEEMIDILVGEVKRLKTELVKYELIKELMNNESENFLVGRKREKVLKRQGVDLGYTCDGSCETEKETSQELKEKDIKRVQDREKEIPTQSKNQKRTRKGVSKQEAMKHSKPSKKKNKVICKDCGGEYLTVNFHSHYARHIK